MTRQRAEPGSGPGIGPGLTLEARPGEEPSPGAPSRGVPTQPFHHLDALWVQVAGTLCNLACSHCFVSCGPHEARHEMMSRADVRMRVAEALALGVKEIYFTGGEPFLHGEIEAIVEETLAAAPVTVLTNGTLFTPRRVAWLVELSRRARYSLELRVSLDGTDAETHDAFRGPGAWVRAMAGLAALSRSGLFPIATFTQPDGAEPLGFVARCDAALRAAGVREPRIKLLPMFRLGREAVRSGGYASTLAGLPAEAFDPQRLQCGRSRAVTSRGAFVCPLLVDEPGGRMADTLAGSLAPFALVHGACTTCWATGMTCANGS